MYFSIHFIRIIALLLLLSLSPASMQAQQWDNYRSNLHNRNVKIDSSNLPIVFINVKGKVIQRDRYVLARMKIIHNGDGNTNYGDTLAYPNQTTDYEGWIALKYRGNTSFDASDKKPFAFRTLASDTLPDNGGSKKKVKLLGMPKDNKWGFIAPWADETMFRDVLTFDLSRPWMDWVPRAQLCELILDGTYYGVFVLCERVSKGKHRLDLKEPGEVDGDLSGDYHVCIDHGYDPYFRSQYHPWQSLDGSQVARNYWIKYEYGDPDNEEFASLPTGARQALQAEVNKMEASFMDNDWQQPDGGYRKKIDVQSFIDYMLATELSMNIDGYRLSTHLYKHGEKRAEQEGIDPRWKTTLWDYNIAWGNANYYHGKRTDCWQYEMNINFRDDDSPVPFYWYRMLQDTAYVSALKSRWQQYRQNNHQTNRLLSTVDSLAMLIKEGGAALRNEQAWGIYSRSYIWPIPYYAQDYDDAVDYLKGWIRQRLQFLDKHLLPPRVIETEPVMVASGWNADVVAESLPCKNYTSVAIDGSDRTFYSQTLRNNGGMPANRLITSANEDVHYQLAPYDSPNALTLRSYGQQGTLEFQTPIETSEIFVLATSGNGESSVNIRLNYADGTHSDAGIYPIRDWSVRTSSLQGDEAVTTLGNIRRDNNSYSSDNHYCLFDFSIPIDDQRPLQSVTFTNGSYAYPSILAFSTIKRSTTGIALSDHRPAMPSTAVYDLNGVQLTHSRKGLNIVRYSNGTVRKVMRR
ncbi:MAG: CotH kinase family protein [Prevotella sp.]